MWASGTNNAGFHKSTLQLNNGHLQIVQTFDEDYQVTIDISDPQQTSSEPHQVDPNHVIVQSTDPADFIMQENDYIGDLQGTHLIMQDDCNLVWYEGAKSIWTSDSGKPNAFTLSSH